MHPSTSFQFLHTQNTQPTDQPTREAILANPGFGRHYSDHMVSIAWETDKAWHACGVSPYAPLVLDPASLVLHYAQAVFEGLKAYRHADGSIWTFRPRVNAQRFSRSAERLGLPELPEDLFIQSLRELVQADQAWVPNAAESSLYLRPFMIANENSLSVRGADKVAYYVIGSPAGPYFSSGVTPVPIWVSTERTRAARGGTGYAKCAGNYAGSLAPLKEARKNGCPQVLFLDSEHGEYLEELGGMNIFIVQKDGSLITPALSDSILPGVTRASIIELAHAEGREVQERAIGLTEVREGLASKQITEIFACGTAALIFPISVLKSEHFAYGNESNFAGPVTLVLRKQLIDIQYGFAPDAHNWMVRLV
ncbi:MAG: branched chain amino acid aminotransferase [Alcaligenaceae bacterium]|nr:MAG: branched chain amino acid aminotransferase [Alcaligenaceae bacterium]